MLAPSPSMISLLLSNVAGVIIANLLVPVFIFWDSRIAPPSIISASALESDSNCTVYNVEGYK